MEKKIAAGARGPDHAARLRLAQVPGVDALSAGEPHRHSRPGERLSAHDDEPGAAPDARRQAARLLRQRRAARPRCNARSSRTTSSGPHSRWRCTRPSGRRASMSAACPTIDTFVKILSRAEQIGGDWEKHKDNLCWPGANPFYLYDEPGRRTTSGKRKKKTRAAGLQPDAPSDPRPAAHGLQDGSRPPALRGGRERNGLCVPIVRHDGESDQVRGLRLPGLRRLLSAGELRMLHDGRLREGPEQRPLRRFHRGRTCGNNFDRICIGERIYDAAVAERDGVPRLRGRSTGRETRPCGIPPPSSITCSPGTTRRRAR